MAWGTSIIIVPSSLRYFWRSTKVSIGLFKKWKTWFNVIMSNLSLFNSDSDCIHLTPVLLIYSLFMVFISKPIDFLEIFWVSRIKPPLPQPKSNISESLIKSLHELNLLISSSRGLVLMKPLVVFSSSTNSSV